MSEVICPHCASTLFESELREGECTGCMRRLPTNWARKIRGDEQGVGEEDSGSGWETVRRGTTLLALAALALTISLLVAVAAVVLAEMRRASWMPEEMPLIVLVVAGLIGLAGLIVGVIGFVLSLFPPRRLRLRGLIFSTVGCFFGGIGLIGCCFLVLTLLDEILHPRQTEPLALLLLFLGILTLLTANMLFFLYLRGIARYFGERSLGRVALAFGIVSTCLAVFNLAARLLFENMYGYRHQRDLEILFSCGVTLETLALFIWNGILLLKLRALIPRKAP